jgi:hypothetical protein
VIDVYFRIVGLYFGSNPGTPEDNKNVTDVIQVSVSEDPSAKEITKAAEQKAQDGEIPGVTYAKFDIPGGFLTKATVTFDQRPKEDRFDEFEQPRSLTLEKNTDTSPILAWQYYVQDVDHRRGAEELQQKNTNNEFIPADQDLDGPEEIEDGDMLTWRLVAIQNEAKPVPLIDPEDVFDPEDFEFDFPRPDEFDIDPEDIRERADISVDELRESLADGGEERAREVLQSIKDTTLADRYDEEDCD